MQGQSFLSLEISTQAEISVWLRDPEFYLYQLQCAYRLTLEEIPSIRRIAGQFEAASKLPDATEHIKRSRQAFKLGHSVMILIASRISRALQLYNGEPGLVDELHEMVDDMIDIALSCYDVRPLGAGYVSKVIKVVLTATFDDYRRDEMEAIMADLQQDFPGADYMADAEYLKTRFEAMESKAYLYE